MADLNGFDADQVEPASPLEPVPTGLYVCVITESEMKETKAGTGEYLQLTFEVYEGEFKGRKFWARLNLNNPNQTAVDIARQELSAICRAVDVLRPRDSEELHDLPLLVKVVKKKRPDTGEETNEVKAYYPREHGQKQDKPKPAAAKQVPEAPWGKKKS